MYCINRTFYELQNSTHVLHIYKPKYRIQDHEKTKIKTVGIGHIYGYNRVPSQKHTYLTTQTYPNETLYKWQMWYLQQQLKLSNWSTLACNLYCDFNVWVGTFKTVIIRLSWWYVWYIRLVFCRFHLDLSDHIQNAGVLHNSICFLVEFI